MTTDTLEAPVTTTDPGTQDATPAIADTTAAPAGQEGTQATAGAEPAKVDEKAPPAPADYESFNLPEGLVADEELFGEFKALAKNLNLSQEDAQKFVDIQAKNFAKNQEAMAKLKAEWAEQSKTDKEFGGEVLNENIGVAKKALEAFASPELRKLLDETGFGNHPELIRTFVRIGKAISEDGRVVSGSKAGTPSDPAKRLFPNQA